MFKTVDDMYKQTLLVSGAKLLSNYSGDFWQDYLDNSAKYDKLFRRFYKSFKYFLQTGNESVAEVTTDFIDDVYNHLMLNDKKYSELYRIHVVDDEDYSLLNNYNVTEIMDKDVHGVDTNTYGSRTDSGSNTKGQQTNTSTGKVAPYNSSTFANNTEVSEDNGSRTDSSSYTAGSHTDSLDNTATEDYTLTRIGNIGIMTGADMLEKHNKFWSKQEFYQMIFREIARELLLV